MCDIQADNAQLESYVGSSRRTPKRGAGQTKTKSSPKHKDFLPASNTLDTMLDVEDNGAGSKHSLAHELAVALMPQPTAGSKMLADELGLEFEEGAEGIDEVAQVNGADGNHEEGEGCGEPPETPTVNVPPEETRLSASAIDETDQRPWDPFVDLSRDMQSMDSFLSQLRRLDGEYASTPEPVLEKAASQLIRRLNDSIREREGQVRQLLQFEREFRRISNEVGGNDILGSLDELETVEGLVEERQVSKPRSRGHSRMPSLNEADEDEWERNSAIDPSHSMPDNEGVILSPISPSFPKTGPVTPSSTIPHVTHFRNETKSLARSLISLSEQTQVNGAATADAGRKIRALKNKLSVWQAEMESAERSRERIASWERAGRLSRRVNGRDLVQEQLTGFKRSLEEAASKANAIMAAT